jgi:hypothetical protein
MFGRRLGLIALAVRRLDTLEVRMHTSLSLK